ncbi:MAG: tetratricopeptide repeat protein [Clostridia bacterium]|nr:tetratricopeptide repeat protein [Clostridia bacterium]
MAKKERIDLSEDRLLDMAAAFIDDHNYTGALKMLHKNAEVNFEDDRTFLMYAEIYDDLAMYEDSINNWFRYLDVCDDPDLAEAYEGLAVNYMQVDNESFSAYYYNKMLIETEDLSAESRREIIDHFIKRERNPLKFAYPPEKADYTADISEGIEYIKAREPEKSVQCFERVAFGNDKYILARNYIAMAYVLSDNYDEAEKACDYVLSLDPANVQALTTLAAVRSEQNRQDDAVEIAKRLVSLRVTDTEDIYKIATVCCENKLHAEAYALFCKLDDEVINSDKNMLYFKAAAAYNSGNTQASLDIFDTLVTLYPDAVVAKYYYDIARENADGGEVKELSYFYRLPQDLREQSLAFLSAIYSLSEKDAKKLVKKVDGLDCIKWCFDETESSDDNELHYVAAECAVKTGYDDYVRSLLLNAFLPDNLKISIIRSLCERNENNQFGVVICNIYKAVDTYPLEIGRAKRKLFLGAYGILVSRFGIIDEDYSMRFAAAAEIVYEKLEKAEALNICKDSETLAAVIVTESGIREQALPKFDVCDFFNADKKRYEKIISSLK